MSAPPRRRNPSITPGRKSDRKKKKMGKRNTSPVDEADGLTEFREKSNQQRKELIRGDSSRADKSILSEPSILFFEKTDRIRSNKKDSTGSAILFEQPKFQLGVEVSKVKQERMLVIQGSRSSVFQELDRQFKDQKKNLKQEQRESQTEVLEKARKRQEEQRKIAAVEKEKKRLAKEKEDREADRAMAAKKEKLESERLAKLELERQQERERLQAIEQQKIESERLATLELERLKEVSRKLAIKQEKLESERLAKIQVQQQEQDRLEAIERRNIESERLAKLDLERQQELEQVQRIEHHRHKVARNMVAKEKNGLLMRLLARLRGLFKSKSTREVFPLQDEVDSQPSQESDHQDIVEEAASQEEDSLERVNDNQLVVVEVSREKTEIGPLQKIPVDDKVEREPVGNEEVPVAEQSIQPAVEHEQQLHEIEVSSEEFEVEPSESIVVQEVLEEDNQETEEEVPVIDDAVEHVLEFEREVTDAGVVLQEFEVESTRGDLVAHVLDEVTLEVADESSVLDDPVELVIVPEYEPIEVEVSNPEPEVESLEEDVAVENAPQKEIVQADEEAEQPQTNEVVLADLRITLRDEPQPIEFIKQILMDKHNLSKKDVEILIDQVASPFSICKTMTQDIFYNFIISFDDDKNSSGGVEPWTQVIQLIGLESLSEGQQIEIYDLFMGEMNNLVRRVTTVALLYHFLPQKFERWWRKEMVPEFVLSKKNSDYTFFNDKQFTNELIEEARMLLCAFAIEKPNFVANEYTYAKHKAGKTHENQTENWLNKNGKIKYITESDIPDFGGKKYGNKFVNPKITPDILLRNPIQLSAQGQHIHWIDAKKHFIDPAFSPEYRIEQFCNQIEKYARAYGPGLVVWGKDFSEEWNDATEGVVQHIKI